MPLAEIIGRIVALIASPWSLLALVFVLFVGRTIAIKLMICLFAAAIVIGISASRNAQVASELGFAPRSAEENAVLLAALFITYSAIAIISVWLTTLRNKKSD